MIAENPAWEGSAKGRLFYHSRAHQQEQFELVASYLPTGRRRLLDVGCGYGDFTQWLPSGYIYEGIDDNPDVIESAQQLYPGHHFRCSTRIVNANVIVAIAALQSMIVDPRKLVPDMLNHCKLLIVSTVNDDHHLGDWDFRMRDLFPDETEVVTPDADYQVFVTEGNL